MVPQRLDKSYQPGKLYFSCKFKINESQISISLIFKELLFFVTANQAKLLFSVEFPASF